MLNTIYIDESCAGSRYVTMTCDDPSETGHAGYMYMTGNDVSRGDHMSHAYAYETESFSAPGTMCVSEEYTVMRCPGASSRFGAVQPLTFEELLERLLAKIGFPEYLTGYRYLKEAVKIAYNDPSVLESITKEVYPDVAVICRTSRKGVEHGIRNAIEKLWERSDHEAVGRILDWKWPFDRRPTNIRFIAALVTKLRSLDASNVAAAYTI